MSLCPFPQSENRTWMLLPSWHLWKTVYPTNGFVLHYEHIVIYSYILTGVSPQWLSSSILFHIIGFASRSN